jgi:nitrite reductase (NADH) small subunit
VSAPEKPETRRTRTRHVVCATDALAPGQSKVVALGKRQILVVRTDENTYHALSNRCAHQGGPLSGGTLEQMWVSDTPGEHRRSPDRFVAICPWHNFETDVATGC